MSSSSGLMLGHVNTHLPLRERVRVALCRSRQIEIPAAYVTAIQKAIHLRQNAVRYAEVAGIDLDFLEKSFGPQWFDLSWNGPTLFPTSIRDLAILFGQAIKAEQTAKNILPPSYRPSDAEIDQVMRDYLGDRFRPERP